MNRRIKPTKKYCKREPFCVKRKRSFSYPKIVSNSVWHFWQKAKKSKKDRPKLHWSLASGVTWGSERTAFCHAHTSSCPSADLHLVAAEAGPICSSRVEPGAESSTDCVMLRLPICLHANCGSRAVRLFAILIYQMALNKTSANKAIWMLPICQKSVELMATNQIIKKYCTFRISIFQKSTSGETIWNTGDDLDHPLFLEDSIYLQKSKIQPKANDIAFRLEYPVSL